jgi:DNA invertase Pin-like site-specific DNA recombinase
MQWFEDHDSATNLQREAFQKLQAAIFAGKVTTVVVWKLDRLARSLKEEGINVLADWCNRGVRVIAVTQQIDLSGPVGHLIASPSVWQGEAQCGGWEPRKGRTQGSLVLHLT